MSETDENSGNFKKHKFPLISEMVRDRAKFWKSTGACAQKQVSEK